MMKADKTAFGHVITSLEQTILELDDGYAGIVGLTRRDLVGRQALSFTYGEDSVRNRSMLARLARSGPAFVITKRYWRGDRSIVWVRNQVSRIECGGGVERICATTTVIDSPFKSNLLVEHHAAAKRLCEALVIGRFLFSTDVVSAPAAEALLRLYQAELEGEILTATLLAARLELPARLVVRYLAVLHAKGLIEEPATLNTPLRTSRYAEATLEGLLGRLADFNV